MIGINGYTRLYGMFFVRTQKKQKWDSASSEFRTFDHHPSGPPAGRPAGPRRGRNFQIDKNTLSKKRNKKTFPVKRNSTHFRPERRLGRRPRRGCEIVVPGFCCFLANAISLPSEYNFQQLVCCSNSGNSTPEV